MDNDIPYLHRILVEGVTDLGFRTLLPPDLQSPIITSFREPAFLVPGVL